MKKKNILLFIHELTYTGSPFSTLRLARALMESGYHIEVWSYREGSFRSEYDQAGINVKVIPEDSLRSKDVLHKIKKFDLVICNTLFTRKAVEMAENIVPTIWYIREAENIPEFFMSDFRKYYTLKNAKNIWCVSEYAKEFISRYFNKNVQVIPNCVDDELNLVSYEGSQKSDDTVRFYMSGTIEKRKGFDIFLGAYELLDLEYKNRCELHIVGRKFDQQIQYFDKLEKYVKKYSKNIFYHGEIKDRDRLLSLMKTCDVITVISRDESCSLVALEGCMLGKPLLLSQNVGAKYLVDEKNGWIIETGNKEQLKNVVEQIIDHKECLPKMGNASRRKYEKTSTFEKYRENVQKNIEKNFFNNNYLYRIKHAKERFIWWVDDLERVYVPDWGEGAAEKHLFSFDIFDTLLMRKTATPSGIFLLMQEELKSNAAFSDIPQYIKDNFYFLRQYSESLARKSYCIKGCEDKTFDQIYEALGINGLLSEEQLKRLQNLELRMEYDNILGIDENIDRIKRLLDAGKNVVLISDMYLSSEQIRTLLCKVDNIFEKMEIYVSSECRKCKGSTNLFKYVQCEKRVRFSNWTHIGDNDHADGQAPRSIGILTEPYKRAVLKKSEKRVIDSRTMDLQAQLTIGLARQVRVKNQLEGVKSIGASLGGIMLVPYIEWVLQDAKRRRLKTLYFIARDGYVLKMIADIIISHEDYDIQTKYLYGSRKAWRMPSFRKENSLDIFFRMAHIAQLKTIHALAQVFFLPEDVMKQYLPAAYKDRKEINLDDINRIRDILESCSDFKKVLEKESKRRKENVVGYIKQEVRFEDNNFAFVELSGSGATQECLTNICGEFYKEKIITYFLNLDDIKHGEKCMFINYIQNNNRMTFIIENLCRAPHGQTMSYEYADGKYYPVLEDYEVDALVKHGYLKYIDGVCLFANSYYKENFNGLFKKENPQLYNAFLHYISYITDEEILDFIGDMPFETTGFGTKVVEFAPKLSKEQIRNIYFLRDREPVDQLYQGAELQYSVNRCTNEERKQIKSYQDRALTMQGHIARLGKKLKKEGWRYTLVFVFKRTVRRMMIRMKYIPDL